MYRAAIEKIVKEVNDVDLPEIDALQGLDRLQYLQSISCRKSYFPLAVDEDNREFYRRVKINQRLSAYDLNNYRQIMHRVTVQFEANPEAFRNRIFCAFHYGSYRAINCVLHEMNLDFSVVANESIIKSSEQTILNLHHRELNFSQRQLDFEIINVNENAGIMKMIRALREGKSLVIYIDGNNGLGGFSKSDGKVVKVNFQGKDIYSRSGVAFLSHHLGVPIIPVVSWREDDYESIYIKFFKEIEPTGERETYLAGTTQLLWDIFAPIVRRDPSQWEAVFYAHSYAIERKDSVTTAAYEAGQRYAFNNTAFDFYMEDGISYLFNLQTAETLKAPENLFKFLVYLQESREAYSAEELLEVIDGVLLNDLIARGVLSGSQVYDEVESARKNI